MGGRTVPERFLDAGEEPDQTLSPITGYEKSPLVSLKEAIQPIKSLLYNADSMVETAKRNSRKPADGLTSDESAAIHLYTMQWDEPHTGLYNILNQRLRSKNRATLVPWFLFLKLFFTALYKLPSFKGTIWRGVRGNLTDQYDENQIWWGVSSCTETMKIMERFVGRDGVRTIFNIECINGKAIRDHSYFNDENEILLMPGTYLQVVDKWSPAKDLYMIQLRETEPPYETIASPFDLSSLGKLTITPEKKKISSSNTASAESYGLTIKGSQSNKKNLKDLCSSSPSSISPKGRPIKDIVRDLTEFNPISASPLYRLPHDCYTIFVGCLTNPDREKFQNVIESMIDFCDGKASNLNFNTTEIDDIECFLEYIVVDNNTDTEEFFDDHGHHFVFEDHFYSALLKMVKKKASFEKLQNVCRFYEAKEGVNIKNIMSEHAKRTLLSTPYFTKIGLSPDDAQGAALSLSFYTGTKCEAVNRVASLIARQTNGQVIDSTTKEEMKEAAIIPFYLFKALLCIPYYQGYVTRLCQLTDDELQLYMPGCLITWIQFSSSKKGKEVEANFGFVHRNTSFKIYSLTGRPIKEFSNYDEEDEILFLPHSTFFVFKHELSYHNTIHTIYMRQVELGLNEFSILWINNKIFDQNWEEKCHIGSDVIRELNINVNFIRKLSSDNALSFLRSPFGQRLKNKDTFRIIIDINRENQNEGLCLIKGLQQLGFQNRCLLFTNYQIKNNSILQSKLNSKERKFVYITSQTEHLINFIKFEE